MSIKDQHIERSQLHITVIMRAIDKKTALSQAWRERCGQLYCELRGYLAGASRQRVNRALQVLGAAGLVKVDYGLITVLDLNGLQRYGT